MELQIGMSGAHICMTRTDPYPSQYTGNPARTHKPI